MSKLDDVLTDYHRLLAYIDEHQGEVTPEVEQALAGVEESLDRDIDRYLYVINKLSADVQYYQDLEMQFGLRARRYAKTVEWLRDRVRAAMVSTRRTQAIGAMFSAYIRRGIERVVIDDLNKVPDEFKRTRVEVSPNKIAIKEYLEASDLKQCDFARLEETPMLVISTVKPKT